MAARRRMLFNGVVIGSAVVDASGKIRGAAKVSAPGLFDDQPALQQEVESEFFQLLAELPPALRKEDAAFTEAARAALRRIVGKRLGKRPIVEAHILRI